MEQEVVERLTFWTWESLLKQLKNWADGEVMLFTFTYINLIAANQIACQEVWFIGDQFMKSTFYSYQSLQMRNFKGDPSWPYLYDYYEVKPYWKGINSTTTTSPIARIVNALIDAINGSIHLPRLIVFMPDIDVLKSLTFYGKGTSHVIEKGLGHLINTTVSIIENWKLQMKKVKPGYVKMSEPKMIWIGLISKPYFDKVMTLRRKHNEILEDTRTMHKHCYYLNPAPILKHEFDWNNNLSSAGKVELWRSIDQEIRRFDEGNYDSLKPHKIALDMMQKQNTGLASDKNIKRKLPHPPSPIHKAMPASSFNEKIRKEKEYFQLHRQKSHEKSSIKHFH